ncbi:Cytochrome P450 [Canna indica]|uniref:Cytochrome P450 n=1 Tax=Canna indica TaxID=4628 RepID=A0AAQ3PZ40_9LILI|nr:Cytochrome P450 [Canna indica]
MVAAWSSAWGLVAVLPLLLAVVWAVRTLNWAWRTPRRLERTLRAQGIKGTPFRFPYGDLKLNARLHREAHAKPMPFSHDILPRIQPLLHRAMLEYGKISFTWFEPVPRVVIMDHELAKEALTRYTDFGRATPNPLFNFFLRGVFGYDGEKWVKHRKILNPAFHMEKLKGMLPAFSSCCSELMDRWEGMVGTDGCSEIDVWPDLQAFTGNVISRAAFGSRYEDGRRIFQLQTQQAQIIVETSHTLLVPGYKFLPTVMNKRIKRIDKEIRAILGSIIKTRKEDMKAGKANNNDLLGLLMESNMKHSQEHGNKNTGLTTEEVMEECKLFYFAGQETTSVLLTWTLVLLSMHPNWQDRAREEVLAAFGKNKIPDFDSFSHLRIVTMILQEVLRLYPPVTFMKRQTNKTVKLGDVVYPSGVLIAFPVLFIHHHPDLWGKDASEFNPERFAGGVSNASKNKNVFYPFGDGPRICIGQNFAMLEAKMALCMILQRFSFELSPSYAHAPYTVFTLQPQYGAQIMLSRL